MQLITLVGADASGKDTQIALLKNHFLREKKKVQVITIWDSLGEFSEIPDKKMVRSVVETFLLKFDSYARSLFLMSCLKNSFSKINPLIIHS
jgi:thymidylate kinase